MSDLRELYQEVILDHHKRPRNFGPLEAANRHAEGHNPLCGDHLTVYLDVEDGVIEGVAFEGAGCAISRASASLMTDAVKGRPVDEAEQMFEEFHEMVTSGVDRDVEESLGKLAVFCGVREFPSRVKCASLAWHTMHAALDAKPKKPRQHGVGPVAARDLRPAAQPARIGPQAECPVASRTEGAMPTPSPPSRSSPRSSTRSARSTTPRSP